MRILGFVTLALTGCLLSAGSAQEPDTENKPDIDPRAERVLRAVGKRFTATRHFRFRAEISYDEVMVADDEAGTDYKVHTVPMPR